MKSALKEKISRFQEAFLGLDQPFEVIEFAAEGLDLAEDRVCFFCKCEHHPRFGQRLLLSNGRCLLQAEVSQVEQKSRNQVVVHCHLLAPDNADVLAEMMTALVEKQANFALV